MRKRTMILGLIPLRRQAPGSRGPLGWRPSRAADTRRRHPTGAVKRKTQAAPRRPGPSSRRARAPSYCPGYGGQRPGSAAGPGVVIADRELHERAERRRAEGVQDRAAERDRVLHVEASRGSAGTCRSRAGPRRPRAPVACRCSTGARAPARSNPRSRPRSLHRAACSRETYQARSAASSMSRPRSSRPLCSP